MHARLSLLNMTGVAGLHSRKLQKLIRFIKLIESCFVEGVSGEAIVENGSDPHDHNNHQCHEASTTPHSEPVLPSCMPSCSSTPTYYSSPQKSYSDMDQDSHSLTSQDSGIPTLEINPPEPILHQCPGDAGRILDTSHDSPATLSLDDDPSNHNTIRKSSTFPRSGYDSIRLFSPALRLSTTTGMGVGGGALNRSDDISVCSVSSMSTELSVSNEDILDFTVTSDSSAIVTLETDDSGTAHFSDVTLSSSPGDPRDLWSPVRPYLGSGVMQQEEDVRQKKLGPLASLFNRLFVEDLIVTLQEQALLKVVPQTRLAKTSCLLPPLLLITAYPEVLSFNFLRQSRTENEEIPSAVHMIIIAWHRAECAAMNRTVCSEATSCSADQKAVQESTAAIQYVGPSMKPCSQLSVKLSLQPGASADTFPGHHDPGGSSERSGHDLQQVSRSKEPVCQEGEGQSASGAEGSGVEALWESPPTGRPHKGPEENTKELKEAQRRKKQLEDRCKLEESIGTAAQTWNQEILPNWSTLRNDMAFDNDKWSSALN
ncbi:hypothetical protein F2P81_009464 [Scophthalmus maximus]|uniref:Uncharacterized protein n=1 Tax=Scophthalmus maximus TaxID=52904 RepID=A0A6A4T4Q6_SCOMX|nr:hypothetical protein F2P81_009464 [Scophthalmus maximus]